MQPVHRRTEVGLLVLYRHHDIEYGAPSPQPGLDSTAVGSRCDVSLPRPELEKSGRRLIAAIAHSVL
jgi:hypothetical protein